MPGRERVTRAVVALAAAWSVAATAAPGPALGYDDARHLLARVGFGPTDAEVRAFAPLTREEAIAKLLHEARTTAVTPPPAAAIDLGPLRPPRGEMTTEEDRKAFVRQQVREGLELRGWWVREMLVTPSPLTERMTLFWHNHFVSAQPKVRISRLMYRQNVTLRANALGNFGAFLHAIARDPAMVVYLDSAQNRRGAPNENFAREVMELFTLGEGRYSEADVKEAARAFTGWSIDRESGAFMFRPRLHDDGVKTVLGHTGRLDGDAVLDLLLARPETAEFIVAKLWREFVSPDPDPAEVARIARRFRASNYEIKVALSSLLASDAFYAPANRGVLVKSPVELVVGTLRQLELAPDSAVPFAVAAAGMGQNLFSPPNVKGWPGGDAWINTTTLLARKQFLDRLTRSDAGASLTMTAGGGDAMEPASRPAVSAQGATDDRARAQRLLRQVDRALASIDFDSARWLAQFKETSAPERSRAATRLLLAVAPLEAPDYTANSRAFVHAIVLDPAFELK